MRIQRLDLKRLANCLEDERMSVMVMREWDKEWEVLHKALAISVEKPAA